MRVRQIATHHPPSRFRRAVLHDRVAFESEELIEEHPLRVERLHDVGSCMEFDRTRPYGPDNRGNWFESRNAGSKPPPSSSSHSRNSCVSRFPCFYPPLRTHSCVKSKSFASRSYRKCLHSAWKSNQKNSNGRFVWLCVILNKQKGLGGAGALVLQSEHELVAFLVKEIDDDDGAVAIEEIIEVEIEEGSILHATRSG